LRQLQPVRRWLRAGSLRLRSAGARLPVRWRLALTSFGLLAVLLAALGLLLSFSEERALLMNEATALHNAADLTTDGSHPTRAGELINRLSGQNIGAAIVLSDGTAVATSSGLPLAPPEVTIDAGAIQDALAMRGGRHGYLLTTDRAGNRQLAILRPIQIIMPGAIGSGPPTSAAAVLVLHSPTTLIDRSVANTRLILFLGIGGALLLAGALALPLVSAALRPLKTMERVSSRIAEGELSLRLEEPGTRDEIGRL